MSDKRPLFTQKHPVQKNERVKLLGQRPLVIWFTGLSGSGKSTLAGMVEEALYKQGFKTMLLDGDNVRKGLCKDLGFDEAGRMENMRRIGELCKLFNEAGLITLTAFISPFREERRRIRSLFEADEFVEVYVSSSLELCEERDPNGLYKMARRGEIRNFTGIDSPYEKPENSELLIDTSMMKAEESAAIILKYILTRIRI
jgi:adenylyl-sulfate kinase